MKKTASILLLAFLLYLISSCSSTRVTATWKADELKGQKFDKIMVIGLTSKKTARAGFESNLVEQFKKQGIEATSSIMIPALNNEPSEGDKEKLRTFLIEKGYDAVITISLLDRNESTYYVPGSSYYVPGPGYYSFGPYYYNRYYRVYEPGYYSKTVSIYLETNLYKLQDGALIWSAQSETVNPSNPEVMADEYAKAVVKKIIKENVLIP